MSKQGKKLGFHGLDWLPRSVQQRTIRRKQEQSGFQVWNTGHSAPLGRTTSIIFRRYTYGKIENGESPNDRNDRVVLRSTMNLTRLAFSALYECLLKRMGDPPEALPFPLKLE
ncbi:Hypothetical predicted protein [Olea europaea subsp. europaea]|uniref:Uncharacterized protein n=1 Tax=Olea europaea subsp. europaea TaxID=158383 RepID=A0A8S0R9L5_OLEEU|nr:Hypothetical predicted protein [Olea europaea subsp. europaea]